MFTSILPLTAPRTALIDVTRSVDASLKQPRSRCVNHSVEETTQITEDDELDDVFHALANKTRRALLSQLAAGPARVNELARPHGMSVNAVSKHLFVLERAGLIRRERSGHVLSCALEASPMATADDWLRTYRHFWSAKIDQLAEFVERKKR